MNKCYVDLHMHTKYSDDADFSPSEIVQMCFENGIKIMAITDHNWVKAIDEASQKATELGIQYLPATEIDCTFHGLNLHVLGYGIDHHAPIFNQLGERMEEQERACSLKRLALVNALGFDLRKEQLDSLTTNGVYIGEMFGEVLLNDERYLDHELLKPYRQDGTRADNPYVNIYWDFFAQGKPCYVELELPTLEETIQIIKDHGGVAVLAHPGNNLKGKFELFEEIINAGIQGVEVYSNYHTKEVNDYFYRKAKDFNLLMTCGSDFHGKTKPAIHLAENGCDIPEEIEFGLKKIGLLQ